MSAALSSTVLPLRLAEGLPIVPRLSDYNAASDGWAETEFRVFENLDGSVAGSWRGEPGWVEFDSWPYTEVCFIQSGSVTVETVDESGLSSKHTFGPGEAFVIPQGIKGRWTTEEKSSKFFVGIREATPPRLPK